MGFSPYHFHNIPKKKAEKTNQTAHRRYFEHQNTSNVQKHPWYLTTGHPLVQVAGSKLYAAAMDPEKVLEGLSTVVELLQSRCGGRGPDISCWIIKLDNSYWITCVVMCCFLFLNLENLRSNVLICFDLFLLQQQGKRRYLGCGPGGWLECFGTCCRSAEPLTPTRYHSDKAGSDW